MSEAALPAAYLKAEKTDIIDLYKTRTTVFVL